MVCTEFDSAPHIANSHLISEDKNLTGISHYECDEHFGLKGSHSTIFCTGDGKWSYVEWECLRKYKMLFYVCGMIVLFQC